MDLQAEFLSLNFSNGSQFTLDVWYYSMYIRGVQKVQKLRYFKTGLGRSCVYSKSNLWNKKIRFWTISGRSTSDFVTLGLWSIWNPPNMVKWTQNWKSMSHLSRRFGISQKIPQSQNWCRGVLYTHMHQNPPWDKSQLHHEGWEGLQQVPGEESHLAPPEVDF